MGRRPICPTRSLPAIAGQKAKPNILLFLTDQHRLSALGCYGPTSCQTPNIDQDGLCDDERRYYTGRTKFMRSAVQLRPCP